jgi:hypothetical protein
MRICRQRKAQFRIAAAFALLAYVTQAQAVSIDVGSGSGAAGTQVQIPVTLSTMSAEVGGTENEITFDPAAPIVGCTISPLFAGLLSSTTLRPQDCTAGVDCQYLLALISRIPPLAIPDGTLLYTCNVSLAANAEVTSYPLACSSPIASNPSGTPVPAQCTDGQVQVLGTPTPTDTPVPGMGTPTPTTTPTPAPGNGGGSGCEVAAPHGNPGLLLLPAAMLLLRRRRAS